MTYHTDLVILKHMASEYSKMPLWKMILLYVVIGGVIYGLIYYFVFAKKGGYNNNYNNSNYSQTKPLY